jgi:hypothetical protein
VKKAKMKRIIAAQAIALDDLAEEYYVMMVASLEAQYCLEEAATKVGWDDTKRDPLAFLLARALISHLYALREVA